MLKQTPKEFRALFLLKFTNELIKNSAEDFIKLENIIKRDQENIRKGILPELNKQISIPKIQRNIPQKTQLRIPMRQKQLSIPHQRFPQRLQYIRPVPTEKQIDLGKLNPLIKDSKVKIIECNGPSTKVRVKGSMGIKESKISLTKEEIKEVINVFSAATKIPVQSGVVRIALGKLVLSAIISETIGSKFIIEKMQPPQRFNPPQLRR